MKPVMITIPEPCHENWNNMTPAEQGRYCAVCSKEVKDFSNMNDEKMQIFLNKTSGKVCGRFDTSQVNRELIAPENENGLFKHLWKLLLPGFFFAPKAFAQKAMPQDLQGKDSVVRTDHRDMILGMVAMKIIPKEKKVNKKDTVTAKQLVVKEKFPVINDKVKLYPNPVAGNSCSLSFAEVEKGEYTAQLTDINGKLIQQSSFTVPDKNYVFHLDLVKGVSTGAYLLRIVNKDGKLFYNGKIVLE